MLLASGADFVGLVRLIVGFLKSFYLVGGLSAWSLMLAVVWTLIAFTLLRFLTDRVAQ